ncbi:2362_t:CDS:2 [Cetraspora pellucida]|uniref:2362_t:CDS:1 n=1 Tax=Cetraspora pellucida TaxID=1433469 RepID=A0A9N9BH55_9GLOM|nr:2362_t:CDS:2 [Cetraspora pellucida]
MTGETFELDNVNPTITVGALKTMIRNGNYVTSTIFELYKNDFARVMEENMKDQATVDAFVNTMLPEVVKHVHSYWEIPYAKMGINYVEEVLYGLISKLEPKTSIHDKALALKRDFLNLKKRKRFNEKENSINENDRIKSSKKTKREISTGTSLSNIVTNSLPNLKYRDVIG